MADLEAIYSELIQQTKDIGALKAGLVGVNARLDELTTEVKNTRTKIDNGISADLRTVAKTVDNYLHHDRRETCFFLLWKCEQEKALKECGKLAKERRWNVRSALLIGALLALFGVVTGIVQARLTDRLDKSIKEVQSEIEQGQDK